MKMKKFLGFVIICIYCLNLYTVRAEAISLDVANADVRELLTMISVQGNINMVLDDSVQGTISLKLSGLSADEMIEAICKSNNYTYRYQDKIIYINKSDNEKRLHHLKVNYLNLQRASQMVDLFLQKDDAKNNKDDKKTSKDKDDNDDTNVVIDYDDNNLIFYASDEDFIAICDFMQNVDLQPRQVLLEAKVTAVQKDAQKNLGISWEWSKFPQSPTHNITYDTIKHTVQNSDGSFSQVTDYIPVDEVTRNWQGTNNIPGVIRFGKNPDGYPYEFYYSAQLNALINDGKANILASPNIMTIQGNEAVINIGSEVPVPTISTTDATTTTSIEYREAGIILKCIPRVNEDGFITVKVHTEVSSPFYVEDMKAYRFQKRSADTMVRLKDGETMVIGGLIGSDEAKQMSKVPFLGDIPILGNLFKNLQKSKSDTEVMIFLTAHEVK